MLEMNETKLTLSNSIPHICEATFIMWWNLFNLSWTVNPFHPDIQPREKLSSRYMQRSVWFSTHCAIKSRRWTVELVDFFLHNIQYLSKIHIGDNLDKHQSVICSHVWNSFTYSISTLSLFALSAAPGGVRGGGGVSGPIMRNTCWLTQIEITTRESDCSCLRSTHVTSFSNHCPCTERNPLLPHHPRKRFRLKTSSLCFLN